MTPSASAEIGPQQAGRLLDGLSEIVARAAAAIMATPFSEIARRSKSDQSPVTAADVEAERIIVEGLGRLLPGLAVIAEESVARAPAELGASYAIVDPLDGTKEFLKRNGEFTVNIALIDQGRSILGVVLAPVTGELYVAAHGHGAWLQTQAGGDWQRIRTRPLGQSPLVAGSRSHGGSQSTLLQQLIGADYELVPLGSSLKFCLIARGAADVYLRLGLTSEWDTAAAQCVLDEAGGAVLDLSGQPFRYNRGESLLNPEFIAVGDTAVDWAARLQAASAE